MSIEPLKNVKGLVGGPLLVGGLGLSPLLPTPLNPALDTQIATIRSTVLIQSTRVTDRQTDGQNSWARTRGAQLSAGYTVNMYSISRCAL